MSFMILGLDWVQPRSGIREERGGRARRERLRARRLMSLRDNEQLARVRLRHGGGGGGDLAKPGWDLEVMVV